MLQPDVAQSAKLPPGPTQHPLRQGARFGSAPYQYLSECARLYGDCFTLRLPADAPRVVCSHPEDVHRIFALSPEAYTSNDVSIPLNIGAQSLLFLDGERHLSDRRLMVPPLHGEHLEGYARTMEELTAETVASWPVARPFALHAEMQKITLGVILRCVFGLARGPRIERLARVTTDWLDGTLNPAMFMVGMVVNPNRLRRFLEWRTKASDARYPDEPRFWRVLPWQRLADRKAELVSILKQEIAQCRASGHGERRDVLAMLIAARYEDGGAMDDDALLDELVTLLVGGHETTANSLCWLFHYLLTQPAALARVREELATVCADGALGAGSLKQLVYLDACVKESMRLCPIAPAVSRNLSRPLALRNYELPAGTIAWASVYLTHTNPEVWTDPHTFRPERFLGDAKIPANQFLPFGGGRRRCIGMAFASLEMLVVAASILRRADLRAAPDASPTPVLRGITISPSDGLRVLHEGAPR